MSFGTILKNTVAVGALFGGKKPVLDILLESGVVPVKGSIVYCDLWIFEHSGVYVGDDTIIHRDGRGYLAAVQAREFRDRLDRMNTALCVYVSCREGRAVGRAQTAEKALNSLNDPSCQGYDLVTNNCHQFCQFCLTGAEPDVGNCSFGSLKDTLEKTYKMDGWRPWEGIPSIFSAFRKIFTGHDADRKKYEAVKKMYEESIEQIRKNREYFGRAAEAFFERRQKIFDDGFAMMERALDFSDLDLFTQALNGLVTELGSKLQFSSYADFNYFMKNDQDKLKF
ncbi:MAG: lecithin retinol acyltransferase family protein [Synergistaceae bacterium]|jgi:hypothetical protein|nr:lecithin retinol acyltransferase family protein [Synergistaceae bacterium]